MKLTLMLIAIAIAGFALPLLFVSDIEGLYNTYGFSAGNLIARPYVLVTSVFLHGSLLHLLSNIFVLFFFGAAVERETGARMLAIFFIGAFAGDMLSLFFYGTTAIGASAGVFALVGAGMLMRPIDISFYPLIVPVPLALLGMMYAAYNAYGLFFDAESNIAYMAHFGGLLAGLLFGFRHKGMKRGIRIILVAFLAMIAAGITLMMLA